MQIVKTLSQPDIVVLQPSGRITVGGECETLVAAVDEVLKSRKSKVVLDMVNVTYIDSAALGTIMSCATKLRRGGGDLWIANPLQKVMNIFTLTGTSTVLHIYPDIAAACAGAGSAQP